MSTEQPKVVGASDANTEPEPESKQPSSLELPVPRRRLWPLLLVLAMLFGAAGLFAYRMLTKPLPLRILIAIDMEGYWWEGSKPAAKLADKLSAQLKEMGFDPVRAGDPETMALLEDAETPQAAAHKLRAAFIIKGRIPLKVVELPIAGKYYEVQADEHIHVQHVDEPEPLLDTRLRGFSGAKDKDNARSIIAKSMADQVLDVAVPAIMAHPHLQEILNGRDAKLIDQLAAARAFLNGRKQKLDAAKLSYDKLAADRSKADEKSKITFLSPNNAEDRLIAVHAKGLLLSTADVDPWYAPEAMKLYRREQLETVQWRNLEGKPGKLLWQGYNVFTYPSATTAGAVLLVEDLYGWARGLFMIDASGKKKRLLVEPTLRLREPHLSPDGKAVALLERSCRGCARAITVRDLSDGKATQRFRIDPKEYSQLGSFGWLATNQLLLVMRPARASRFAVADKEKQPLALWLLSSGLNTAERLAEATGNASLGDIAASADGKYVAVGLDGLQSIGVVEVASRAVKSYPVKGSAGALAFSPDGKHIAFEHEKQYEHSEIAVLELSSGKLTVLTHNKWRDRRPMFSADGKKLYFEARNFDPVFGRKRAVVRIAMVPVP